ncbi:MAG TPA: DegT/DnrJ/EryC1/StrS family aminotransferase [Candidatus Nanoarchaeia archaeon]|nr:DegT/DnrJ/EryC1/StrS family aminotransferase [Candidatus Nanoarchaeia archaeon]
MMFMLLSQQRITPRIHDLFSIFGLFSRAQEDILEKYIPKKRKYWLGSGREALRQILLDIQKKQKKSVPLTVGLPAYTCHVMVDAVKQYGSSPVFYDSAILADIKDISRIIKRVDVLVLCYNFGFLPEIEKIAVLCKQHHVILVEDCAQALGAKYQGRLAGSFGEYAFYSFGISKTIGFCGGLIATDKELLLQGLRPFPFLRLLKTIVEVIVAPVFFHRSIYPLTNIFLRSELEKEQQQMNYTLPTMAKKVVLSQFKRYDLILSLRRKNAEYLLQELSGKVHFQQPLPGTEPSWLYFCFLDNDEDSKLFSGKPLSSKIFSRKLLSSKLLSGGIEAGKMLTFQALANAPLAKATEEKVSTIALYRPSAEVKKIVEMITMTIKDSGDYAP